jgi:enamine deaminase RidA (YjgF/YER057c/UK114 family)
MSGTVPPVADEDAPEGSKARYGDMETQAIGTLQRVKDTLEEHGLSMNDVVFLKVYLAPDEDGSVNFEGWSAAYRKFFGTEETPTKPARSTMAVHQLFSPAWRVEVEAIAARPE